MSFDFSHQYVDYVTFSLPLIGVKERIFFLLAISCSMSRHHYKYEVLYAYFYITMVVGLLFDEPPFNKREIGLAHSTLPCTNMTNKFCPHNKHRIIIVFFFNLKAYIQSCHGLYIFMLILGFFRNYPSGTQESYVVFPLT